LKEQETLKTDTALPLGKTDSMIFSGQGSSHGKIAHSFRSIFVHKVALYGFKTTPFVDGHPTHSTKNHEHSDS
jgi:hypothetical protein